MCRIKLIRFCAFVICVCIFPRFEKFQCRRSFNWNLRVYFSTSPTQSQQLPTTKARYAIFMNLFIECHWIACHFNCERVGKRDIHQSKVNLVVCIFRCVETFNNSVWTDTFDKWNVIFILIEYFQLQFFTSLSFSIPSNFFTLHLLIQKNGNMCWYDFFFCFYCSSCFCSNFINFIHMTSARQNSYI